MAKKGKDWTLLYTVEYVRLGVWLLAGWVLLVGVAFSLYPYVRDFGWHDNAGWKLATFGCGAIAVIAWGEGLISRVYPKRNLEDLINDLKAAGQEDKGKVP